jgi:hypothetical protein
MWLGFYCGSAKNTLENLTHGMHSKFLSDDYLVRKGSTPLFSGTDY